MIKVGIFIDTYYPMVDGVISVVDNCAKRLQGEDFEVTVFCPIHDKKYVDDFNYKVERCKSFKVFFLDYRAPIPRLDRAFLKALRESNLDIVHIHSAFALGSMATRYAKKHNIPCIGVSWGYGTVEDMEQAGASAIAHSIQELMDLLRA